MTAPIRSMPETMIAAPDQGKSTGNRVFAAAPEYELYRVILDYEALQDGFLDRIEDLDTTMALPSFADGVVQKLLTKSSGRHVKETPRSSRKASLKRTFGWESLGKMLHDTGLALVLVVDDERFGPVKEQLAKRRRVNKPTNAGMTRPTWLFTMKKAREMGKKRFATMSPEKLKKHQRKAAKARWKRTPIRAPKNPIVRAESPPTPVCD